MSDKSNLRAYHPIVELLQLLFFCITGAIIFTFLGLLFYYIFFTTKDFLSVLLNQSVINDVNYLRSVQIFSSIGIFIIGPLAFARFRNENFKNYFHFKVSFNYSLLLIFIPLMYSILPLIEGLSILNKTMHLPSFLKDTEQWMKLKEEEAAIFTKLLLKMDNITDFIVNFLMIALIAGIGEELLFRGALQNILYNWFKNAHASIWIAAIIFSAIHLQFYGFIPRMLLGALFGYALLWGKSLWFPIIGHIINNGTAVVIAYIFQLQGKNLEEIENSASFSSYGYILSAIITLVLLVLYKKKSKQENQTGLYE